MKVPTHCPAGHRFKPGQVLVGYLHCLCAAPNVGHTTWTCEHVDPDGTRCGLTVYELPHDRDARTGAW